MKRITIILGVNTIVMALLLVINPISTKADFVKAWDDEFNACWLNGEANGNYREHSCFVGTTYVTCVEQNCTMGIYNPTN